MDANLEKAGDDGFYAIIEFVDGFVVDVAVDASDGGGFGFAESAEEVFGLLDGAFEISRAIIRDNYKEGFVHNVGFLSENVDKVDVVIHENAEEHIVIIATKAGEAFNIRADVDFLGADENLNGEIK